MRTKIHAVCYALGNPVGFHLTAGQDSDLEGVDVLMGEITKAKAVFADNADESVRHKPQDKGCTVVIPPKKNWLNPSDYDKKLCKERH